MRREDCCPMVGGTLSAVARGVRYARCRELECTVDWDYTPEDQQWRAEVRKFLDENLTEALQRENVEIGFSTGPETKKLIRKLADMGWNALTWPAEYGGKNVGAVKRLIFVEEWTYAQAPAITYVEITNAAIAPVIIKYGTPENKADWLEPVRRGDVIFALGYSEPQAGTDLAGLTTRAVLDGEEWVINGQKIWNSAAHVATHEWLAVRTGPSGDRHGGISVIAVPIDAPGVEVHEIKTWHGHRTNQTFFTDVRVPRRNLIGEPGGGWQYLAYALDFERITLGGSLGHVRRMLDDLKAHVKVTRLDGSFLADQAAVRRSIAELEVRLEAAKLMALDVAVRIDKGETPTPQGTALKVYSSELRSDIARYGMSILGIAGVRDQYDELAPLGGILEHEYRANPVARFGGGTNDVMREIVAQRGLGLPRGIRRLKVATEGE
jgi:3-oxocholest-4-en-26-oyl-CoA dehydrogenase alpha subunit